MQPGRVQPDSCGQVAYGLGVSDPALLPEIRERVDLCLPDGRLDPAAVGWSRRPLHRANLRGRGRNKRWEYWAVQTPELVLAVTVSDLDYAGLHAVWFLDPAVRRPARPGWSRSAASVCQTVLGAGRCTSGRVTSPSTWFRRQTG